MWDLTCLLLLLLLKSLQSCPTLCDPIDGSPPGSAIPRILQARTLEWVAISFSNAWKWKVKVTTQSCLTLRPHGLQPTRLLRPWDFPGKSTGVGCHCLFHLPAWRGIKPTFPAVEGEVLTTAPRGESLWFYILNPVLYWDLVMGNLW